jgi:hypothetical protein
MYVTDLPTFTLLIPCQTSESAHAWIGAFFLQVSAMLPQNQHMVLKMMKEIVPADCSPDMSDLSAFVDYTAIVASQHTACKSTLTYLIPCLLLSVVIFLGCPLSNILKTYKPSTFFIIKAKGPSEHVPSQVPQAVYQMFMCGKLLQ